MWSGLLYLWPFCVANLACGLFALWLNNVQLVTQPRFYREVWEKVNVTWLENGDKVEFGQKKTFFFREDLSIGLENSTLVLPNMPMIVSKF